MIVNLDIGYVLDFFSNVSIHLAYDLHLKSRWISNSLVSSFCEQKSNFTFIYTRKIST